jgi:lysophospholipase L1-like esterase
LGGTQISSGNSFSGISGAERMERVEPFYEDGTKRDIRPAILTADLCVIYYGTNDLVGGKLAQATGNGWVTDTPRKASDAQTIRGALYFMINMLRSLNPDIKILVLPPVLRRADGELLIYSEDKTDVINKSTGQSILQYRDVMKEVCQENGAKFIDWSPVFTYENFCADNVSTYSTDGLHPNAAGHQLMFDYLLGLLAKGDE